MSACAWCDFEHAQRGAGLQAQAFHGANEGTDFFDVTVLGGAPGGAHAKAGGAGVFGGLRSAHHFVHFHQLFGLHAGVELGSLRAVATIFGAAAGFDRQQRGQLDIARGPVLAVHGLRLEQQVQQGLVEQRLNGINRPRALGRRGRHAAMHLQGLAGGWGGGRGHEGPLRWGAASA